MAQCFTWLWRNQSQILFKTGLRSNILLYLYFAVERLYLKHCTYFILYFSFWIYCTHILEHKQDNPYCTLQRQRTISHKKWLFCVFAIIFYSFSKRKPAKTCQNVPPNTTIQRAPIDSSLGMLQKCPVLSRYVERRIRGCPRAETVLPSCPTVR